MEASMSIANEPRLSEALTDFDKKGYISIPEVLNARQIQNMTVELEAAIDEDLHKIERGEKGVGSADSWMVHNFFLRGPNLLCILDNPTIHSYLSEILSPTCVIYACQSSSMPPNATNYSCRIHVDSPRFIPGYVSNVGVMVALNDFTLENGATYFLPGSHLSPDMPEETAFFSKAERAICKAGDGILFNARTWHCGGVNKTSSPRHSLTINVCRSFMKQRFDFPRMLDRDYPHITQSLSELGKRFLGYNVRMPTSLEEFYLPLSERLYKPGQG